MIKKKKKNSQQTRNRKELSQFVKERLQNITAIILNHEKLESFPQNQE